MKNSTSGRTLHADKLGRIKDRIEAAYEAFSARAKSVASRIDEQLDAVDGFMPLKANNDAIPGRFYQMSNEMLSRIPTIGADGQPMRILGNEERFTAAYYSEPLTQYATGWTDPENLEALVDFIAPRVPVGRRFEFKQALNVEAFLSEVNDERQIGSEFKRIEYRGATAYNKTSNRGLQYRLDLDEEGVGVLTEELIVSRILQRLRRNQYRRAVATLLNLSANTNTNVTWTFNTSTNSNAQPDENIRTLIQQTQVTSGVFPNRLFLDLKSWNIRKATYASQQLGAGAIFAYGRTIDDVVADQSVEGAMISKALYQSAEWVNPTKSYILPQNVVAFYGQDNVSRDDPTNLKHFVTPVADGDFRVYRQPVGAKFVDISVEYYDQIIQTATVGIAQLTVT